MIQYPKTTHVTLPSVDNYYLNTNILRDPPKAIFTRKVDKVFQNNDILKLVDESGDRVNEMIRVYARGKNPFVKVSYDNYGTNGGQVAGSTRTQVSLPYKVNREGAFRPTGLASPRDLLPLSRMAYVLSEPILSTPSVINYAKERVCPTKFREVKQELLSTSCRPTATIKIEKPITEMYSTKFKINSDPVKASVNSGVQRIQQQKIENKVKLTEVRKDALHPEGRTNISGIKKNNNNAINTEQYIIEDVLHYPVHSNITNSSTYKRIERENEYEFERNTPLAEAFANKGGRSFGVDTISSRDYKLNPTISYGSFHQQGTIPTTQRPDFSDNIVSEKNNINKKAYQNFENRYQSVYPKSN